MNAQLFKTGESLCLSLIATKGEGHLLQLYELRTAKDHSVHLLHSYSIAAVRPPPPSHLAVPPR